MAIVMDSNRISSPSDWQKVWEEYKLTGALELRNRLVELYSPLVKRNAEIIKTRLPREIELEDLISVGVFGLMDAISTFDLSRGVKFETYCIPRIRGAILDELRMIDWVPRLLRYRARKYQQAVEALHCHNGNGNGNDRYVPTAKEISDHFGIPLEDAEKIESAGNTPVVHFYQMMVVAREEEGKFNSHNGVVDSNAIADPKSLRPEEELSKDTAFNDLISCLSDIEQVIITLYYRDGYEMQKIGKILGFSESRVSQMNSTALQKIKDSLTL